MVWTRSPEPSSRRTNVTVKGKIYGVPSFAFVDWMYYQADWFKDAGLVPPKTFDDFENASIKLTDASKNRFGFGKRGAGGGEGLLIEVIRSFGSPIVDDKGQPAKLRSSRTSSGHFSGAAAVPVPFNCVRSTLRGDKTTTTWLRS